MKNSEMLEGLAEDVTEDIYEKTPIDGFGKSVLAKLGWKEGEPLDKNSKPILYMPRQKGLGLGARPLTIDQIKGMKNMGKNMQGKRSHNEAFAGGAQSKNYIGVGEEVKKEEKIKVGSKVYIYKGQHRGLTGIVTKVFKFQESGIVSGTDDDENVNKVRHKLYPSYSYKLTIELDINHSQVVVKQSKVVLESKRKELQEKGIIGKDEPKDEEMSSEHSDSEKSESSRSEKK